MANFWKNKKVLVVGGTGFIGSHTADALIRRGARVFIVDQGSRSENVKAGKHINSRVKFYEADAAKSSDLARVFKKEKPEFVMNFAALADIPLAIREPLRDAQSIIVAVNILENSVRFGVKKILHASSGFVYGNTKRIPTPETERPRPANPYVISKIACENYFKFFNVQYGLPHVVFRYANVYGPRRSAGAIAYFIRQAACGGAAEIYGKKTRDSIFISDVVRANLLAFERNFKASEPVFNIGSGLETDFTEVYSIIKRISGNPALRLIRKPARGGEIGRMCLDIRKAKKIFGFAPSVALEDGLRRTVEWYLGENKKK